MNSLILILKVMKLLMTKVLFSRNEEDLLILLVEALVV